MRTIYSAYDAAACIPPDGIKGIFTECRRRVTPYYSFRKVLPATWAIHDGLCAQTWESQHYHRQCFFTENAGASASLHSNPVQRRASA